MKSQGFKTIIVGLDFSKGSKNAYLQSLELSSQSGANVLLVHIIKTVPSPSYILFEKNQIELSVAIKKNLIKFYKIPSSLHENIIIKAGMPELELIKIAKKHHSPLIVIASSGTNAFSRFIVGSTAERIAVTSSVPVWIQKGRPKTKIVSALIPFDLSNTSNKLLKWSEGFFAHHKVKKTAAFVQTRVTPSFDYATWYQIQDQIESSNEKDFAKLKSKHRGLIFKKLSGDAATELLNIASDKDLVIVAPHSSPAIFPTFGSVSAKIVRKSDCSVLVVPL